MADKLMLSRLKEVALEQVRQAIGQHCRTRNEFYGLPAVSCAILYIDIVKGLKGFHYQDLPYQQLYKLCGELTTKGAKRNDDYVKIRDYLEEDRPFTRSPYFCAPLGHDYWNEGYNKIAPYRNLVRIEAEYCQARARQKQIGLYVTTRRRDLIIGVYHEKGQVSTTENWKERDRRANRAGWMIEGLDDLTRDRIGEQRQPVPAVPQQRREHTDEEATV